MWLPKRLGLIYGILVILIVAMGTWWVVFLNIEGRNYERYHLQRLATEQIHAVLLIQTVPEISEDPENMLSSYFPELIFQETPEGTEVLVDPEAEARVKREARRRQRMFISEGIFFLCLLAAGTTVIILAYRREREFKSARELFLAGATHEFRTPLASLQLYTETLTRPELKAEDRKEITRSMLEDLSRLESLVEQVLALRREEYLRLGEAEVLDLAGETRKVMENMEGFLKQKGARLETSLVEDCRFLGIRSVFALALGNLVQNAVLYSPPPARIQVTMEQGTSWHILNVRDWGPGIPRRYRKKIFQSFYRIIEQGGSLARKTPGSGLGLFLVKRNIEMLGGKIEVSSEEGQGTAFIIRLPASREEPS
jgi:signal transduction histidine kinase